MGRETCGKLPVTQADGPLMCLLELDASAPSGADSPLPVSRPPLRHPVDWRTAAQLCSPRPPPPVTDTAHPCTFRGRPWCPRAPWRPERQEALLYIQQPRIFPMSLIADRSSPYFSTTLQTHRHSLAATLEATGQGLSPVSDCAYPALAPYAPTPYRLHFTQLCVPVCPH